MALTQTKTVTLPNSNVEMFYREEGKENPEVFLLLHGFPSSSHQYRKIIPLLAKKYHVVAPDYPGFGFTEAPSSYPYNFANLTAAVSEFLDVLDIAKFYVYIQDYGAPIGLRLALEQPDSVRAIVSQNGNAYVEGLGPGFDILREFWTTDNGPEARDKVEQNVLTFNTTKAQYVDGEPDLSFVGPESYTLDYALLERPDNKEHQLDLFYDYQTNVALYDDFQQYFRDSQVPLLAIWGENDQFFIPPGAEAFKRDLPDAKVELIDAGHFAVESHAVLIADNIFGFLGGCAGLTIS